MLTKLPIPNVGAVMHMGTGTVQYLVVDASHADVAAGAPAFRGSFQSKEEIERHTDANC